MTTVIAKKFPLAVGYLLIQFKIAMIYNPGFGLLHKWDTLKNVSSDRIISAQIMSGHCFTFRRTHPVPNIRKIAISS
jgi:hypothetical protein